MRYDQYVVYDERVRRPYVVRVVRVVARRADLRVRYVRVGYRRADLRVVRLGYCVALRLLLRVVRRDLRAGRFVDVVFEVKPQFHVYAGWYAFFAFERVRRRLWPDVRLRAGR